LDEQILSRAVLSQITSTHCSRYSLARLRAAIDRRVTFTREGSSGKWLERVACGFRAHL